jgi:N-acyl-D-aspartate/D-glutamate deacylase
VGDLLVRGGIVVDGTGAPAFPADLRVRDGRIVEIASGLRADGETELDAGGAYVSPGFIDTHTHFDPSLFWDDSCDPMPQHGVTSVLYGNCGLSLAPIRPGAGADVSKLFCYIEDMPEAAFATAIPWTWSSYGEYADAMRARTFSVNAAGMVGHSILRLFVIGDEAWERPSTPEERARIAELLRASLRGGAVGMSSSLGFDEDRSKRPVPSRVADDEEFRALLEVLAAERGFLQFIPSPIPKYMTRDVERIANLSRGLDLVQTWINIFVNDQRLDIAPSLMEFAAGLQRSGVRTYPQVSPRTLDIQVNWQGGMSFYTLGKSWHPMVQADPAGKRRMLQDPAWRAAAREEWESVPFTMIRHQLPENIRLVSVTRPENEAWVGKSLADLVAARGGHPSDVLADWLLENDLKPGIVGTGVANADPDAVAATLQHPATIISNSDAGAHVQMMCAAGDTTLLLTRHVRDRGDLSLEQAVWEITGRQSELFGFTDRGILRPGAIADLTVFDLDELHWDQDTFVHDLPGDAPRLRRPAGGFRYTVVDGVPTQVAGEVTGDRPGRLLDGRD